MTDAPRLDPLPWVFTWSGNRYRFIDPLLDKDFWRWSPAPGYSQKESDYA